MAYEEIAPDPMNEFVKLQRIGDYIEGIVEDVQESSKIDKGLAVVFRGARWKKDGETHQDPPETLREYTATRSCRNQVEKGGTQKGFKLLIGLKSQTPVPGVDPQGNPFSPKNNFVVKVDRSPSKSAASPATTPPKPPPPPPQGDNDLPF
jgi:hypothetical protein